MTYTERIESVDDENMWKALCIDMFSLLDAIEAAEADPDRLRVLIRGRFDIIERHGLKFEALGTEGVAIQ